MIIDLTPSVDDFNTPCMYDKVSQQFFYNQGTGEFSCGIEELECPPVDYVEYLSANYSLEKKIYLNDIEMPSYKDNWSYEVKFNQTSRCGAIVGGMNVNVESFPIFNRVTGYLQIKFGRTVTTFNTYTGIGTVQTITYNINGNKEIIANGIELGEVTAPSNFDNRSFINLFYSYDNSYPSSYASGEFYYFKIWDNDTDELIHYVRPFVDDNNVPCVYDEVTGKVYIGEDMTYGNCIHTPITYIESNGTQYIDTGVIPTDNTDIDMICRACPKYTEVEYIQGDGASWLDTNIIPDITTKVVVDAYSAATDCLNGVALFGATDSFLSYSFQTIAKWLYVGKLGVKHSLGSNSLAEDTFGGRHIITIDLSDTVNVVNVDGVDYGENIGTTTTCVTPILLFNKYDAWGSTYISTLSTAKIYSFKIYQSDELVFDGIPVLDSNGESCLYDKINNTFLYNQGEGTFINGEITDKNYIMNNTFIQGTYKYQDTNTIIEPNLTASEGATLTLGETNLSYLSEDEIQQATEDGWNLL